jgi:5-methylcytosine-specific restriction protein A
MATKPQVFRTTPSFSAPTLENAGHQSERHRFISASGRPTYHALYKLARWKRLRRIVLAEQPICQTCQTELTTDVDHIQPHRGNESLFWARDNLQGLCASCHSIKTAKGL